METSHWDDQQETIVGIKYKETVKLTEDVTYFGPLPLPLQEQPEFGADVDVAHVVQQGPDHGPREVHHAAEAHELAELERGRTFSVITVAFPYAFMRINTFVETSLFVLLPR